MDEAYKDCFELPLFNWVKRIIDNDNKWLVKSGNPGALDELWLKMKGQYQDLLKDTDSSHIFDLTRDITTFSYKVFIIKSIINQLRLKRNEELINILKTEFGFRLKYDDLEKDLNRSLSIIKSTEVQIERKKAEKKSMTNTAETKEWTEFDYIEQLSELSKFQGAGVIHIKQISVAEYVALLNRFKAYCAMMEEQLNPNRNGR